MYRKNIILCDYCKEIFGPRHITVNTIAGEKDLRKAAKIRGWKRVGPDKDACPHCINEKRHKRK